MESVRRWFARELPHPDGADSVGELTDTNDAAVLAFACNKYAPMFGAIRVLDSVRAATRDTGESEYAYIRRWSNGYHETGIVWAWERA